MGGLFLGSITASGGCQPQEERLLLDTRLVETSNQGGSVQGFYFGELEMLAYDYRPGATVQQTGQHFGFNATHDWSYWGALMSGHESARDLVLQPGQQFDAATLDEDNSDTPDKDFIENVGVFDIDLFEVYMYRTGVLHDNVYYGMNADFNGSQTHPLYKYPAWASWEDHYCDPEFPGQAERSQDLNVFFVRSDWFPQPVNVTTAQEPGTMPIRLVISHSSVPLTPDQESLILSLVNNGTQRRFYSNLLFIPMPGPVSVKIKDTASSSNSPGTNQYVAGKFRITINFDMSDIIHPSTDWSVPRIRYNGDPNNIPFGLAIRFDPL
ncbi:hypothetical protein DAT35_45325 [Vitiosangium sp. GDMCC 1.1324]|nr:hypothetical protein DAT35_45325 [Vitiosangium sp. GDMCC 1.1324]